MKKGADSTHNCTEQADDMKLPVAKQALRRRAILSGASALLVVVLILGAVLAWYTRLTNVSGMTFDVAAFDINASYLTDSYILNPFTYEEVTEGKSAPGVKGYVPITVYTSAEDNDVNINYRLNIDTGAMASEFEERINFYYYTLENGKYVEHALGFGEEDIVGTLEIGDTEVIEHIYWEWLYEADISTILISPSKAYSSGTAEADIEYTEYDSLDDMTAQQIYYAIYYWRYCIITAGLDSVETYYNELMEDSVAGDFINDSTCGLYRLYAGVAYTATTEVSDYGDTTYAADTNDTSAERISYRGANIKDFIEYYVIYEWDYIDTQAAIGTWDETMTSANGSVFSCEYTQDEDGEDTEEIAYYAYQMAMQVSIEITALQAEPLDDEDVSSYSEGGGTVKYETGS